jgi:hypothetical protein
MVKIRADLKEETYLVKLETGCRAAKVTGLHLTPYLASEIGFEQITNLTDVIEETRHLEETADGWSIYGLKWTARGSEAVFTRVYVRKLRTPKGDA